MEYDEKIEIQIKKDGYFNKKAEQSNIYKQFSLLCIELKLLYVGITRAKNRVIIYDDFASRREPIQQYWEKLNCVHLVSKAMLDHPESMPTEIKDFYELGINDSSSSPDQWKIQGIKFFKKKYFD